MVYTHYIQQRDRELKKVAAMRAHNIGFYKPKPLARVMPGHLLLLTWFQSVRCPFQTEHHHLKTNRRQQQGVETCLEQAFIISRNMTLKKNRGCVCHKVEQEEICEYTFIFYYSYQLLACHHGS